MSVPLYVVKCADFNPNVISSGFSLSSSIDELLYSYSGSIMTVRLDQVNQLVYLLKDITIL